MNTTEKTYEMLWDCKFCGQKKLLGLKHRFCAGCGAPQDASARYFPSDDEKIAVEDHPFVGADLECPACKGWNSRAAKCCTNCGGPLTAGHEAHLRQDQVHAEGVAFAGESAQNARSEFAGGAAGMPGATAPALMKKKTSVLFFIIPAALVAIVSVVLVLVFWKKTGSFEVGGHSWERAVDVEKFGAVRKSSWCDELPFGSHELVRHREQRSTKKTPDGQDCKTHRKDNGDGTFKEIKECTPKYKDEPVYGDKCDYDVNEWSLERTARAKGASVKETPTWPKTDLARPGTCLGCEREGARHETYTVRFVDPKKAESTCNVDAPKWASFADGSQWDGKIGVLTGALDCDSLIKK